MRRSIVRLILLLALGCLVASRAAEAQQRGTVYRIRVLGLGYAGGINVVRLENLRLGLRELGYVEGRDLTLEYRWAEGRPERCIDLAAELVRLPVDLIVVFGNRDADLARHGVTFDHDARTGVIAAGGGSRRGYRLTGGRCGYYGVPE